MAAPLTIREDNLNGVRALRMEGKLTLGEGASAFRETVKRLVESGAVSLVLDLSGVSYVDSAGIGELVSAYTSVTSRGGKLVLASVPKRVADLLQITKLYSVFSVYDTLEQGTAAMTPSGG